MVSSHRLGDDRGEAVESVGWRSTKPDAVREGILLMGVEPPASGPARMEVERSCSRLGGSDGTCEPT